MKDPIESIVLEKISVVELQWETLFRGISSIGAARVLDINPLLKIKELLGSTYGLRV